MKVSHADNDYLKLKKDSSEKYLCVYQYKFYVNHEIYFYGGFFYIPKEKNNKIWHFRNITFMVYIIIKTLRKM